MQLHFLKCRLLPAILFCLFIVNSNAQIGKKKVLCDTLFFYSQYKADIKLLRLKDLSRSTDSLYIRFSTEGQIVDIWTEDGISYKGLIKNYAYSYYPDNELKKRRRSKLFSKAISLDTLTAKSVFDLFQSIDQIPTEDSIHGWQIGCDGSTYTFEKATPDTDRFKTYWSPYGQDSTVSEARDIQRCVDSMYSWLKLQKTYDTFISQLRPGYYSNGSIRLWIKQSKKEISRWKKYKSDYALLYKMKDTINNYLSDTLTKLLKPDNRLLSDGDVFLKISKHNNLVSVRTNENFLDKEEKRDYLYRKKAIKKAFRHIKLDFVHSSIGYRKRFSYFQGKVRIFD